MQQAYQALRIVSEAQTIRIALAAQPDELILQELSMACASFTTAGSDGIKAVVLDFIAVEGRDGKDALHRVPTNVEQAYNAVRAVAQPVLAVVRDTLSSAASRLICASDFTLVAEHAILTIAGEGNDDETLNGAQAARLGYVTWSVPASEITKEMGRILNLLREKSAVALRYAKASARLGQVEQSTPLAVLQRINALYLTEVMRTKDATEGLRAFLERRKPVWENR
jgi:hypothetical protein